METDVRVCQLECEQINLNGERVLLLGLVFHKTYKSQKPLLKNCNACKYMNG